MGARPDVSKHVDHQACLGAVFIIADIEPGKTMWFEELTGFAEENPDQVRENLVLCGDTLSSKINGRSFVCGRLETPSLGELRSAASRCHLPAGKIILREVIDDAKATHADMNNAGALFQVASQFNLLEMPSHMVTPERGVGAYENDPTQGPACAMAAGAGTIYRSYFADINGQTGQTADRQIDCLEDLGKAMGNDNERLWTMQNGYAMATLAGLEEINRHILAMTEPQLDDLRTILRIGIQWDTQVTLSACDHLVSQVYCSALPVAYSEHEKYLWGPFAKLILQASYEATMHAAVLNFQKTGNNKVFLTLIGGGVFGNLHSWIFAAIERAIGQFSHVPLDVAIVSYGARKPGVGDLISRIDH